MRNMIRLALVLALFVIAAASSIVLADECDPGEPCKEDVTVIRYENAPGCLGPVWDGAILSENSSSVYWYKVTVTARAENDSDGNPRCSNNDPPECSGQSCECDLSVSLSRGTIGSNTKRRSSLAVTAMYIAITRTARLKRTTASALSGPIR